MRIMLLSPPNTLEKSSAEEFTFEERITPLELGILAATLERENEVRVIDALALRMDKEEILEEIDRFHPHIVGIVPFDRCRWSVRVSNQLSNYIDAEKIGLLGSYSSDVLIQMMKNNTNIDFGIYGDPEYTMLEISKNDNFKGIKGVIYRNNGKIIKNSERELIKDLDELPVPARHLLPMEAYKRFPHEAKTDSCRDMLISRGCPFHCTYCIMKLTSGRTYRIRSPQKVIDEIKSLISEYDAKEIHFIDPIFTMNRRWVNEFCNLMMEEGIQLPWSCQTRVDLVDKEILEKVHSAGCFSILYGAESPNQRVLDTIKKGITREQILNAVRVTQKIGIEVRLSLMLGLPAETPEMSKKTIEFAKEVNPTFAQFHQIVAFPDTELYDNARKWGRIKETKIDKFDLSGALFIPDGYKNEEEINKMQKIAYKEFYMRPTYIMKKVLDLRNFRRNINGAKIFYRLMQK